MKDFNSSNLNLENKIIQKGVLDLKVFWQYTDEKYFRTNETESWDLFSRLKYLFYKNSELTLLEKREGKDPFAVVKFMEEIHLAGLKHGKFKYSYFKLLNYYFFTS